MRNPDGTLNGDLNDNISPKLTGSFSRFLTSSINENQTVYDLLPVIVNKPPIIVAPIINSSSPQIKPYAAADGSGEYLYTHPDGNVKVHVGSSFKLSILATQPPILNVENGIPVLFQPDQGLTYTWRKDGEILVSSDISSLDADLTIMDNLLVFTNIAPQFAGTYVCEVSNDIGTVESEPITIEVYNSYLEESFYKNLVQNPYGKDGVNGWESNNQDFATKQFGLLDTSEYLKPYEIDVFGYTPDMMFPRPYQIEPGVIKNLDMVNELMYGRGTYFTRTRYKYTQRGGSYLVRAYQDIDLSEIREYINGSIYGVKGVRAFFSCYIGNALAQFRPVEEMVDISERLRPANYVLNRARISVENFLRAGPSYRPDGKVYVTVEEYDNETRVPSLIVQPDGTTISTLQKTYLTDVWTKDEYSDWGKIYYDTDRYSVGSLSRGDVRDQILFTADKLFPDQTLRFTYGQYVEFNKMVFDKLNPKTTKIRITLNFETNDVRLFAENEVVYNQTSELLEFIGWEMPAIRNSWAYSTKERDGLSARSVLDILKNRTKRDKNNWTEFVPAANDPRGFVTAVNFAMVPILTEAETNYVTQKTLALNSTPTSSINSPILFDQGLVYDPNYINTNNLRIRFGYKSTPEGLKFDENYKLYSVDYLEFQTQVRDKETNAITNIPITKRSLLPFDFGSPIFIEDRSRLKTIKSGTNVRALALETDPKIVSPLIATPTASQTTYNPTLVDRLKSTAEPVDEMSRLTTYLTIRYSNRSGGFQTGVINLPTGSYQTSPTMTGDYPSTYQIVKNKLTEYGWIMDPRRDEFISFSGSNWRDGNVTIDDTATWQNQVRYLVVFAAVNTYSDTTFNDPRSQKPYFQSYFLDINFADPQNTKVVFTRYPKMYPGTGRLTVNANHNIDEHGVLRIEIPERLLYGAPSAGGLDFKRYADIVDISKGGLRKYPNDAWIRNAKPLPGADSNSMIQAIQSMAVVVVKESPIQLINSLHSNLVPYCNINITGSTYYRDKLKEVFAPLQAEIDRVKSPITVQGLPSSVPPTTPTTPYSLAQLQNFSASLATYAYNSASRPDITVYGVVNQAFPSSYSIDLNGQQFQPTAQPSNLNISPNPSAEFRPIVHILRSRLPAITSIINSTLHYGPSLACVRDVARSEFNDGIATPRAGAGISGSYKVEYAPIQDTLAGTYPIMEPGNLFDSTNIVFTNVTSAVPAGSTLITPTRGNQDTE